MTLLHKTKKVFLDFLLKLDTSWWLEISTDKPHCIYYFGPFRNVKEAETAYLGYVEDLENEAAQGIVVNIKRCKPEVLTVFDEDDKLN
ncbi:DUF1816 domain-containing protein (plasmid) [Nostoc edaphicum CCNP1411]|uniref:DUF1816 domain-containing protein n=1 Tax=Nostoc edaphicum CCNP1411 TaxID=1472755 RepID=A0A7D7L8M3_9NOSO|nr:DUF1816 domain-containing protein [Nostoc edaphicum]QMS86178.1 DUF1816 domain-containing protein [Nostoc edaphicum CCNP1411]